MVVVGAGRHAQNAHLGPLQQSGRVKLAAIVDIDGALARDCMERFGADAWYTDYRAAFDEVEPDIVWVCTPPSGHPEITVAAILAGAKVVFVEKPPAIDVGGAQAIAQAADGHNAKVAYGFKYAHHQPGANAFFAAGGLGQCFDAQIRWLRSPAKNMPHWDALTMKALFGGGVIPDLLGHGMERVMAWTGNWSPRSMRAWASTYDGRGRLHRWDPHGTEVDHRAHGDVIFDDGLVCYFRIAWFGAAIDRHEIVEVDITGEEGVVKVEKLTDQQPPTDEEELRRWLLEWVPKLYRGSEDTRLGEQPPIGRRWPWRRSPEGLLLPLTEHEIYLAQLEHVVDCFEGEDPVVDHRKGVVLQRLINGALDSAAIDARVDLEQ